ncbi:hypothetical protein [Parenemella sanctibonifatiensis]|uniref:DUF3052 family protein n=1 Tax=Parenemella sanctibonifatiensis TaxID=2016505 RepID=A0A255EH03_9ACTN|nr:hypothetical protein [Parenemella sanctibonifatiensis]OYN90818.1 hypothetical protein CGZ91_04775 [Parenemella sanctibonifatiensis]
MTQPVADQMNIRRGDRLWIHATEGVRADIAEDIADGVELVDGAEGATVVCVALRAKADFDQLFANHSDKLPHFRAVWLAYPRGSRAGLDEETLGDLLETRGWKLGGHVAIDDLWSAVEALQA